MMMISRVKSKGKRLEELEIRGSAEAVQATELLRSEYWRKCWNIEETCHLISSVSHQLEHIMNEK